MIARLSRTRCSFVFSGRSSTISTSFLRWVKFNFALFGQPFWWHLQDRKTLVWSNECSIYRQTQRVTNNRERFDWFRVNDSNRRKRRREECALTQWHDQTLIALKLIWTICWEFLRRTLFGPESARETEQGTNCVIMVMVKVCFIYYLRRPMSATANPISLRDIYLFLRLLRHVFAANYN